MSPPITRVRKVFLLRPFISSKSNLLGIDYHYIVSTINMWSVGRFVLASEDVSNLRAYSPYCLTIGIHDVPVPLHVFLPD